MLRNWRIPVILAIALTVLAGVALACGGGGGGSAEDKQAVEQTVRDVAGYGAGDVDAFLERVTDNFLESFAGFTREECRDNAQDCVGDPSEVASLENTKVSGDTATTEGTFNGGEEGGEETFLISFVRVDGEWKVDGLGNVPQEIPGGVKKVNLELNEFAFGFNASEITDGNFAFAAKNVGKQNHQVGVLKVPADADIQELIQSEEEEIPGVEDIAFTLPFPPGDEVNVVFDQPLEPGRYALLCFVPDSEDPEGTPHALKGMTAEFTIE